MRFRHVQYRGDEQIWAEICGIDQLFILIIRQQHAGATIVHRCRNTGRLFCFMH